MVVISAQNALATAAAKLEKHINLLKYTIFCLSVVILICLHRHRTTELSTEHGMNVTGTSSTAARASVPSRGRRPATGPGRRTRPPSSEAARCEVCDVRTRTKIGKWKHVHREHIGDVRLKCSLCYRRFSSFYVKLVHERKHHPRSAAHGNGRQAYTCELCGTYRCSPSSLIAHVAAAHPAAMSALCGICAVYMGDAESLTLHMRHVHQEMIATVHGLQCDLCGKRCRDPKRLRSHRRVHGVRDMVHREYMLLDLSSVVLR